MDGLDDLGGRDAPAQQCGGVGIDGGQEARVLLQTAAQGRLGLLQGATPAQHVGQRHEGAIGPAADGRRVAAGPVAHLQAAAQQRLLAEEIAGRAGGERLLEHDVGEAGEDLEDLVARGGDLGNAAGVAQRVHVTGGQRGRIAVAADASGLAHRRPRALEVGQGARRVAGGRVLRAEVEVQERVVDALGHLALEQFEVAVGLVLGVAHGAEVAEVLDAHRGALQALGQVGRQVLGDLLVDAALEAVLGAIAEHAHRVVRDRRAVLDVAGVIGLGQEEGLAPGTAGERAQALSVVGHEHLVGVEVHDPVAGGGREGRVARRGEVAVPDVVQDAGAVALGDLDGAVGRSGVDDDDLVDRVARGLQAAPDHRLLVLDDHAQAEGQTLGRARGGGDAVDARLQLAHEPAAWARTRTPARLRRVHSARLRSTLGSSGSRRWAAVNSALAALRAPELVEDDARVVEQHGLARVGLEHVDRGGGGGQQVGGTVERFAQPSLQQRAARLVAAVGIGDLAGLGDDRAVAGPVAGGEAGWPRRDEAGGGDGLVRGRAGGFGGIDETEGHVLVHRRAAEYS